MAFPQERGREVEKGGKKSPLELGAHCKEEKHKSDMMTVKLCGVVVEFRLELLCCVPVVLLPCW